MTSPTLGAFSAIQTSKSTIQINEDKDGFLTKERKDRIVHIVAREGWEALPARKKVLYDPPHDIVWFTHTNTPPCTTELECVYSVQYQQFKHMDSGPKYPDIKYNFLIGGDGRVYEGRGWMEKPEQNEKCLKSFPGMKEILEIAFIGTLNKGEKPGLPMLEAARDLINYGMLNNLITAEQHLEIEEWNDVES